MPLRSHDGHYYIVDADTERQLRADRRLRIVAWLAIVVVSVAFWGVVLGMLL